MVRPFIVACLAGLVCVGAGPRRLPVQPGSDTGLVAIRSRAAAYSEQFAEHPDTASEGADVPASGSLWVEEDTGVRFETKARIIISR
jgi:hypothetical protein